ncbi:hypothetical protein BG004_004160 [Podila humilis]|nr:hypothetical protein BG004_004160 [Podila humilis]
MSSNNTIAMSSNKRTMQSGKVNKTSGRQKLSAKTNKNQEVPATSSRSQRNGLKKTFLEAESVLEDGSQIFRISSSNNPTQSIEFRRSTSKYQCPLCNTFYLKKSVKNHVVDKHSDLFQPHAEANDAEPFPPPVGGAQSERNAPSLVPAMSVLFAGFSQWLESTSAGQQALTEAARALGPAETSASHKTPGREELLTIVKGGPAGLATVSGANITWSDGLILQITCVECYGRSISGDPHAENQPSHNSSLPLAEGTGMERYIRVVVLKDGNYRQSLVIGTYDCTYLVTGVRKKSGRNQGTMYLGPSICAGLVGNRDNGQVSILQDNSDALFLGDESCLQGLTSLAQVRSEFGNPKTYLPRRSALFGYHCLERLPTTIFTLALCAKSTTSKKKASASTEPSTRYVGVFGCLYSRSLEAVDGVITLSHEDIVVPGDNESTLAATYTRQILGLFGNEDKLQVTNNDEAEALLTQLADCFSSTLSKINAGNCKTINEGTL